MKFPFHKRDLFRSCLTAALVVLAAGSVRAATIAGVVINGTNNDRPQPGAAVQIVRRGTGGSELQVLSTVKTDAAGRFRLELNGLAKEEILTARIAWQGYTYENLAYAAGEQAQRFGLDGVKSDDLSLTIFDGTTAAPPLSFMVHHVAIETEERALKCIERIVVVNPSQRTFVGEGKDKITLRINLPAEAQKVELDPSIRSGKLVRLGNEWGLSLPLTPEKYESQKVIINYTMPWRWNGVDLTRKLNYATRFFFIAREEKDRKLIITAPQLSADSNQPVPIEGEPQVRIVNQKGAPQAEEAAFAAGTVVNMNVARPRNPLVYAFVGFLVVLCVIVPLTLFRTRAPGAAAGARNGSNSLEPSGGRSVIHGHYSAGSAGISLEPGISGTALANPMLTPELQECIAGIAQLDDEWEAGTIARVTYLEQRAALKNQALAHMAAGSAESST